MEAFSNKLHLWSLSVRPVKAISFPKTVKQLSIRLYRRGIITQNNAWDNGSSLLFTLDCLQFLKTFVLLFVWLAHILYCQSMPYINWRSESNLILFHYICQILKVMISIIWERACHLYTTTYQATGHTVHTDSSDPGIQSHCYGPYGGGLDLH